MIEKLYIKMIKLTWIKINNYLQVGEQEDESERFPQHQFSSASLPDCASTLLLSREHHLPHSPPLPAHGPNQWNHDHNRQVHDNASVGNTEDCDPVLTLFDIDQNGKYKCGKHCCHGETHIILSLQLTPLYTHSCGCAWDLKLTDSLLPSVEKNMSEVAV